MSNLENTEISKLVELLNIFEKKHTSLETWLKAVGSNEVMLRYELIDYINEYLSNAKYDGEDNYDNIYWFAKGLSLPPPKPLKRYVDNPEYKENEAISDLFKIQPQPLIKHYVIPHNSKYKQLLNELINNPPLLRPLPPQIMKPLKPYAQKLFEGQNEQYIEFIKQYGHDFKSKDEEYLIVNEPHDREQALRLLQNHRKKYPEETVKVQKTDDPIVVYYLNRISTLEDIFNYLTNTVFKQERKPFKLTFELSGIFELPVNSNNGDVIRYEYDARTINFSNTCRNEYLGNIPIIIQLPQDLERVKLYIESVLHNYNVSESSVKLTIVSSIAFNVSRLVKVTGKIEHLPEEFVKSRLIIADNEDDKLCWYRFLSICLDKTLLKRKLFHRTSKAKMLLCEEHGHPYTTHLTKEAKNIIDNFNGTSVEEMKESAKKHKINVNIYEYFKESKTYGLSEQWFFDESFTTYSALLFSKARVIHIMYILDAEKLTNIMICPKCRSLAIRNENRHAKQRMEQHVEKCDGKFKKNYIAEKVSLPYCPHILDNPVYEYCLANNLEFKPQQLYMTYDFETMEQIVNESITKATTINSRLIPLSVSCCIKSLKGLNTKHFDARDTNFIPKWIDFMFKQSKTIVEDKYESYREMLHIESNEQINEIVKDIKTVTVFGFNSSRFDSNLFKEYFNHSHWSVNNNSMIGTATSLKQFILTSNKTNTQLRFIDAQAFVAGGTLKQFGKDFGGIDNSNKGVFPYEAINSDNFNEVLSKSEPFKHEDFYSSLTQKNLISREEYEAYLEDTKRFKNRWDYLLSYNDNLKSKMMKKQ